MANIDVSEVLNDPDFQDAFQIIREAETIDQHGRAVDTAGGAKTYYGVIQPASGDTLQLMPDLARTAGTIEVWTQEILQGETDTTAPDVIIWQGNTYTVSHTDPWFNWGTGWVHAVCVRRNMTGTNLSTM
jgi:hypothetical protein